MFSAALHLLQIKDLKDLRAFFWIGDTIDMQDLKDLKRCFHVNDRGGQAPALRYARPPPFRERAIPNYGLLKVRRTLMSIARGCNISQGPLGP